MPVTVMQPLLCREGQVEAMRPNTNRGPTEAGHTVARLISSTRGDDLTFVSIIPRLDGS